MNLLVLLKQVPEPESLFSLEDGRLVLASPARRKMSALDEAALEAALLLKDARPETAVTVLTVGPPGAGAVLERALGMGADRAVRLSSGEGPAPRPLETAGRIAAWAGGQGFDLILAGASSEDAGEGAVGPMLAELLDMPWVSSVVDLEMLPEENRALATREGEGGQRRRYSLPLPGLCTLQSTQNQPRYPTLSNLLKAKKTKPLEPDTGLPEGLAPREEIVAVRMPERTRAGVFLPGGTEEKAGALLGILKERGFL